MIDVVRITLQSENCLGAKIRDAFDIEDAETTTYTDQVLPIPQYNQYALIQFFHQTGRAGKIGGNMAKGDPGSTVHRDRTMLRRPMVRTASDRWHQPATAHGGSPPAVMLVLVLWWWSARMPSSSSSTTATAAPSASAATVLLPTVVVIVARSSGIIIWWRRWGPRGRCGWCWCS